MVQNAYSSENLAKEMSLICTFLLPNDSKWSQKGLDKKMKINSVLFLTVDKYRTLKSRLYEVKGNLNKCSKLFPPPPPKKKNYKKLRTLLPSWTYGIRKMISAENFIIQILIYRRISVLA